MASQSDPFAESSLTRDDVREIAKEATLSALYEILSKARIETRCRGHMAPEELLLVVDFGLGYKSIELKLGQKWFDGDDWVWSAG